MLPTALNHQLPSDEDATSDLQSSQGQRCPSEFQMTASFIRIHAATTLMQSQHSFAISKNPKALKIPTKYNLCSVNEVMVHICLQHDILSTSSMLLRSPSKKDVPCLLSLLITMCWCSPDLWWRHTESFVLSSCLITQNPFCSSNIKESSKLMHLTKLQLP